jgi:hypothetical protein
MMMNLNRNLIEVIYIDYIHTLSPNIKFIYINFKNRKKSNPLAVSANKCCIYRGRKVILWQRVQINVIFTEEEK